MNILEEIAQKTKERIEAKKKEALNTKASSADKGRKTPYGNSIKGVAKL